MWVGKEWGAMTIYAYGPGCPGVGLVNMRYESSTCEDWPHPYDSAGNNTNIYFPIEVPGFHWPFADSATGIDTL